ncbi:MAG: TraX family protein [Fusobacteria bacterium]|nr:MAG: TraX family protein [Fusobacteriota bacterium]KAF0229809.1 MAG: TraX family [Fusobacteriota bacterium]
MSKIQLNNSQLKYIAAFFMFIDHFAFILLEYGTLPYFIGRGIGRLSAPIFFWSISEGALHTKNMRRYFRNIFIFGLVIQLVYTIGVGDIGSLTSVIELNKNIFITLALGLIGIIFIKQYPGKSLLHFSIIGFLCFIGELINADYGWYGILFIILFYLFKENRIKLVTSLILINFARFVLYIDGYELIPNLLQLLALLALPIIFLYNGKRGNGNKYFFYLFYPIHLGLLYLLKEILIQ